MKIRQWMDLVENGLRATGRALTETVHAYHGSRSAPVAFKIGHTGDNSHTFGAYQSTRWGIFFTDNPDFARQYGEVGAYHLDIHDTVDFTRDRHILIAFQDSLDPFSPAERQLWQAARHLRHDWQWFEDDVGERFVAYLRKQGYDSATFTEYAEVGGDEQESHTIVVLDPSLIHSEHRIVEAEEVSPPNDEDDEPEDDDKYASLPPSRAIEPHRMALAAAAQAVYDHWDQSDPENDDLNGGGICHLIADEIANVLGAAGFTICTQSSSHEQHVYCVARLSDGVFEIDVPHRLYETGGGFSWQKRAGIRFEPDDIYIHRLSSNPADMKLYVDDWEEWDD